MAILLMGNILGNKWHDIKFENLRIILLHFSHGNAIDNQEKEQYKIFPKNPSPIYLLCLMSLTLYFIG